MFKTKKYFVLATQFAGGVGFGLLALSLRLPNFFQYSLAVLAIIAFNGATHDIAADGVYINALSAKEQAEYVGWQGAFYNVAKVLSQGVFVYIAGRLEISVGVVQAWTIVMLFFGGMLILLSVYHSRMLPVGGVSGQVKTAHEAFGTFWDVVRTFFEKKFIAWGITFIILYRFAEGQAMKIVPLFMRADRAVGGLGLSTSQIGIIYGFFPPAAFILGSMQREGCDDLSLFFALSSIFLLWFTRFYLLRSRQSFLPSERQSCLNISDTASVLSVLHST
jgi:PAT family beta-lactamase induction signal transducer AmpG